MNLPIVVKAYFGLMKKLMVLKIDRDTDDDDDDDDNRYDEGM